MVVRRKRNGKHLQVPQSVQADADELPTKRNHVALGLLGYWGMDTKDNIRFLAAYTRTVSQAMGLGSCEHLVSTK